MSSNPLIIRSLSLSFRYTDKDKQDLTASDFADYLPPPKIKNIGKSPIPIDVKDVIVSNDVDINGLVSPPFSSVVRDFFYYSRNTIGNSGSGIILLFRVHNLVINVFPELTK